MQDLRPPTRPPVGTRISSMIRGPKKAKVGIGMQSATQIHKDPNHPTTHISVKALDVVEWDTLPGRHQVDEIEVTGFWPKPCNHPKCQRPANPFVGTPSSIKGKPAVSPSAKPAAAGHEYKMTIIVKSGGLTLDAWDPHLRVEP